MLKIKNIFKKQIFRLFLIAFVCGSLPTNAYFAQIVKGVGIVYSKVGLKRLALPLGASASAAGVGGAVGYLAGQKNQVSRVAKASLLANHDSADLAQNATVAAQSALSASQVAMEASQTLSATVKDLAENSNQINQIALKSESNLQNIENFISPYRKTSDLFNGAISKIQENKELAASVAIVATSILVAKKYVSYRTAKRAQQIFGVTQKNSVKERVDALIEILKKKKLNQIELRKNNNVPENYQEIVEIKNSAKSYLSLLPDQIEQAEFQTNQLIKREEQIAAMADQLQEITTILNKPSDASVSNTTPLVLENPVLQNSTLKSPETVSLKLHDDLSKGHAAQISIEAPKNQVSQVPVVVPSKTVIDKEISASKPNQLSAAKPNQPAPAASSSSLKKKKKSRKKKKTSNKKRTKNKKKKKKKR